MRFVFVFIKENLKMVFFFCEKEKDILLSYLFSIFFLINYSIKIVFFKLSKGDRNKINNLIGFFN